MKTRPKGGPEADKEVRRQWISKWVFPAFGRAHDCSGREQTPGLCPPACLPATSPHLHHQHDGVQGDHGHDGVLKGGRHHEVPHAVLEGVPVLRHVAGEGLGTDGKVDARPLKESHGY